MANTKYLIQKIAADPQLLHDITPREFEEVIAELLASFGWQVNLTSATRDGGHDILAVSKDKLGLETTWVIECKRYRPDKKVGVEVVRSIYGVKSYMAASNALIVTTSSFTNTAKSFTTSRYDLQVADYERVVDWIKQYEPLFEEAPYLPRQHFYSCFISYSSKDQDFAERIYADLKNRGVRCWFAPEDLKIGDKIRDRIDESIRLRDKLLLILSKNSIASDWVEHEVESALEEERRTGQTILFPIRLDDAVMASSRGWAAQLRTRHIGDFREWTNHNYYQKAFDRLLRDLKAKDEANSLSSHEASAVQNDLKDRALSSPRSVIKEEWDKVDSSLIEAARRHGFVRENEEILYPSQLVNKLHEAGKINDGTREEFFSLSNQYQSDFLFYHYSSVEPKDAIAFAERAKDLQEAFDKLSR